MHTFTTDGKSWSQAQGGAWMLPKPSQKPGVDINIPFATLLVHPQQGTWSHLLNGIKGATMDIMIIVIMLQLCIAMLRWKMMALDIANLIPLE